MTDPGDRLEALERRVAQLEALVRQLASRSVAPPGERVVPLPRPAFAVAPVAPMPSRDWEQWVGRRLLLAVGIVALIATAGFFLKYAIERGWISPWLRVNGGVLAGALLAVWGTRLIARGLRAYGGAVIGAGGALAYLALWAAAAPYDLIAGRAGILLLLGITIAVAALAVRYQVEALCAWALLGALGAPFFVHPPATDITLLLVYVGLVSVGCGAVAFTLRWRATFGLAVAGFYIMPLLVPVTRLFVPAAAIYVTMGGVLVALATERRAWPEARVAGLMAGWLALIALAADARMAEARWLTLACAFLLTLVVWRHHLAVNPFALGPRERPAELLVYALTPPAAVWLAAVAPPEPLVRAGGAVPAVLALVYFAAGWPRRAAHLVGMGLALVALAIAGQWDGTTVAIGWSALALMAVAADRWNGQTAGRPLGTVLATLGFVQLFFVARESWSGHVAFADAWALAWYASTLAWAAAAQCWLPRADDAETLRDGRAWLWGVAGVSLWLGGSLELSWAFENGLARDLAISAFWLAYAGALVALGFRVAQRLVRIAGLALAGAAALKIVLYDLSALEALYRVGSFLALAIIALAVAYAYHKRRTGLTS